MVSLLINFISIDFRERMVWALLSAIPFREIFLVNIDRFPFIVAIFSRSFGKQGLSQQPEGVHLKLLLEKVSRLVFILAFRLLIFASLAHIVYSGN